MLLEIDLLGAIGFGAIYLVLFILWFKADNARMRESREKNYWRDKYREQCSVRMDEVDQYAKREAKQAARFEIEYSDLQAQCKAAGLSAKGWRKAVEKGKQNNHFADVPRE